MARPVIAKVTTSTILLIIVLFLSFTPVRARQSAQDGTCGSVPKSQINSPVLDCSKITPRYTVINCLGIERMAAMENTKIFIPQVENTAVVTRKLRSYRPFINLIEVESRTMTWDGTEPRDKRNFKSTISYNLCETCIIYFCLFQFLAACTAAIFEGAATLIRHVCGGLRIVQHTRSCRLRPRMIQQTQYRNRSRDPRLGRTGWRQFRVQIAER